MCFLEETLGGVLVVTCGYDQFYEAFFMFMIISVYYYCFTFLFGSFFVKNLETIMNNYQRKLQLYGVLEIIATLRLLRR